VSLPQRSDYCLFLCIQVNRMLCLQSLPFPPALLSPVLVGAYSKSAASLHARVADTFSSVLCNTVGQSPSPDDNLLRLSALSPCATCCYWPAYRVRSRLRYRDKARAILQGLVCPGMPERCGTGETAANAADTGLVAHPSKYYRTRALQFTTRAWLGPERRWAAISHLTQTEP
jgi:hypothetical protein